MDNFWVIVKYLKNKSSILHEDDVIKLGRVKLKIKKIITNAQQEREYNKSQSPFDDDECETVAPETEHLNTSTNNIMSNSYMNSSVINHNMNFTNNVLEDDICIHCGNLIVANRDTQVNHANIEETINNAENEHTRNTNQFISNANVNIQMNDNENINNMNNSYLDDFYLFKNNTSNHEYSNKQMIIENNNNIPNSYAHCAETYSNNIENTNKREGEKTKENLEKKQLGIVTSADNNNNNNFSIVSNNIRGNNKHPNSVLKFSNNKDSNNNNNNKINKCFGGKNVTLNIEEDVCRDINVELENMNPNSYERRNTSISIHNNNIIEDNMNILINRNVNNNVISTNSNVVITRKCCCKHNDMNVYNQSSNNSPNNSNNIIKKYKKEDVCDDLIKDMCILNGKEFPNPPSLYNCRICLCEYENVNNPLISPCKCKGSMKYVHLNCLRTWMRGRLNVRNDCSSCSFFWKQLNCELCKFPYPTYIYVQNKYLELYEIPKPELPYIIIELMNDRNKGFYIVSLANTKCVRMGRGHDSDVRVNDISVSRFHALIKFHNGNFYIEDCKSKFGTLIQIRKPVFFNIRRNKFIALQIGRTVMYVYMKRKNWIFLPICLKLSKTKDEDVSTLDNFSSKMLVDNNMQAPINNNFEYNRDNNIELGNHENTNQIIERVNNQIINNESNNSNVNVNNTINQNGNVHMNVSNNILLEGGNSNNDNNDNNDDDNDNNNDDIHDNNDNMYDNIYDNNNNNVYIVSRGNNLNMCNNNNQQNVNNQININNNNNNTHNSINNIDEADINLNSTTSEQNLTFSNISINNNIKNEQVHNNNNNTNNMTNSNISNNTNSQNIL